ncbi:peroxiredoxin [Neptunicella marina]|uniref:Glutathione-dependent peroxiredoxin n=1 Tax=Neptunicella marina TaxID=2125989 RepID=A0A8J6IV94_9ALTE|nr:peroxiredoxin [Neptunicella marina]MBC3766470.1 peroxiredoxin [Neptunicella marina]
MISVGDTLPDVTFSLRENDDITNPTTRELCNGKKVLIFAVPGAFTPTCSNAHLPGYVTLADKFFDKGIDQIICVAVNDAFVMQAWGKQQNADHITMLADGAGDFAKAIGLETDTGAFGGIRSKRYAMLVENNIVKQLQVEKPKSFEVSSAENMLSLI